MIGMSWILNLKVDHNRSPSWKMIRLVYEIAAGAEKEPHTIFAMAGLYKQILHAC